MCWPSRDRLVPARPRADALPNRRQRRPRRGRQQIVLPGGAEHWVSADGDFNIAYAITPARFLFERAQRQLVELPALWTSFPHTADRDATLSAITSIVTDHALPAPHLVVRGQGRVVVLWHIRPLHYPAALKADATEQDKLEHQRQTFAFRRCLTDWRRAAVKLRLAFAPLGAIPHTPATVDEQLLEHIPFPLANNHPARAAAALDDEAPDVWLEAEAETNASPLTIADISRPLAKFDAAMWACFKEARPRRGGRTVWMQTEATQQALQTTTTGDRHRAALTIVCACVWDGLEREAADQILRTWAATCVDDGRFPYRRQSGDELDHLLSWGYAKLSPGGPTPRLGAGEERGRPRRPLEAAAAALLTLIAAQAGPDGVLAGSQRELRAEAALANLQAEGAAVAKPISRSTFRRALAALVGLGLVEADVERAGRATCTRLSLVKPSEPPEAGQGTARKTEQAVPAGSGSSQSQKGESLWAPPLPAGPTGGGLGDASPRGRGVRGEGRKRRRQPRAAPLPAIRQDHPPSAGDQPQENDPGNKPAAAPDAADAPVEPAALPPAPSRRGRKRPPRALPLPFADKPEKPARQRRARRRRKDDLPLISEGLLDRVGPLLIDGTVAPHRVAAGLPHVLSPDELTRVLTTARAALLAQPRSRQAEHFERVIVAKAQKILRLEAFAAVAKQTAAAKAARPRPSEEKHQTQTNTTPPSLMQTVLNRPLHVVAVKERARRLAEHELSVIVLAPKSKVPRKDSSWTDAQLSRPRVPALWRDIDEARTGDDDPNLAIICGAVSGIVVCDLDDEAAVAWAREHLPETSWRTKTSRGEHWFYQHPGGAWAAPATLPYKGQLQGDGRYVVAPGSVHPDTGIVYEAQGNWDAPRFTLPVFQTAWLAPASIEELRQLRARIRTSDD